MKVGLTLSCYPEVSGAWNDLTPLGLGYLAAYARQKVPNAEVVIERDLDAIIEGKPDLVGLTTVTLNIKHCLKEARRVRETLGCPVLVGGPHYSLLPGILDDEVDVAILGEGEETFVELLQAFQAEGRFTPQSLAKIPGIRYHDNGTVADTGAREHIEDLDQLPFPDRQSTWERWPRHPYEASLMTSRGCPYNCYFCSTMNYWGRKYRYNSVDYVMRELDEIFTLHSPKIVHFYDDLFVGRKDRVLKIMERIRERGWHNEVQFRCFVRSNLLNDELMAAFARTGFDILNIGFESASETVLESFNKQSAGAKRNRKAIELARKHGPKFASSFILGAPGETRQDILETFEFVASNADVFHCAHFSQLMLMPGTELWERGRQIGVSETNLRGVALEPEDITDSYQFHMNHWPYLNEANIPREELYTYVQMAQSLERLVYNRYELAQKNKDLEAQCRKVQAVCAQMGSASFVAEHVPIADILKAKARRRVRRLSGAENPAAEVDSAS